MTLADLQPFSEALKLHKDRTVLPTMLNSAEIRQQLDAATRRQSVFSATNMFVDYLDQVKADVESIINPTTQQRADRVTPENPQGNVSTGLDQATARLRQKELLQRLGYAPAIGEAGTIKDLSSDARINLVLKTNTETMRGAGQFILSQSDEMLVTNPAWELFRLKDPRDPKAKRNWTARWEIAAAAAGDTDALRVFAQTGRMIARKDSPIWNEIGSSTNFDDGLDNPFPPFAFNSGMDVRDIGYREAVAIGLIQRGDVIQRTVPDDLSKLFGFAA